MVVYAGSRGCDKAFLGSRGKVFEARFRVEVGEKLDRYYVAGSRCELHHGDLFWFCAILLSLLCLS